MVPLKGDMYAIVVKNVSLPAEKNMPVDMRRISGRLRRVLERMSTLMLSPTGPEDQRNSHVVPYQDPALDNYDTAIELAFQTARHCQGPPKRPATSPKTANEWGEQDFTRYAVATNTLKVNQIIRYQLVEDDVIEALLATGAYSRQMHGFPASLGP